MKKSASIYLFLCISSLIFSCGLRGISIPQDKQDYIGVWISSEMELSISKGGRVEYKRAKGGSTTSVSAPIQKFEGDNFVVGALGINTTFTVTEKPHIDSTGVWKMTVDGVKLTRIAD